MQGPDAPPRPAPPDTELLRKATAAAATPHIPCTPPPGGVEAEHRYTPSTGVR